MEVKQQDSPGINHGLARTKNNRLKWLWLADGHKWLKNRTGVEKWAISMRH